jgi:geranylgeranyl pyrophosphate synthase
MLWCSGLTDRHRRLAEITEMIHTASLVHDDVLDECNVRRGVHYRGPWPGGLVVDTRSTVLQVVCDLSDSGWCS